MIIKKCLLCYKEFKFRNAPSDVKYGAGKYCSKYCSGISMDKKINKKCATCGIIFLVFRYRIKQRNYCSQQCYGKNLGNMIIGENHPNWKGGLPSCKRCNSKLSQRHSKLNICRKCQTANSVYRVHSANKYKRWRTSVFKRDNYTCQGCGIKGGYLEADHIKAWSLYPEARFELSNGRTLCRPCHIKTDNWGIKIYNLFQNKKYRGI